MKTRKIIRWYWVDSMNGWHMDEAPYHEDVAQYIVSVAHEWISHAFVVTQIRDVWRWVNMPNCRPYKII